MLKQIIKNFLLNFKIFRILNYQKKNFNQNYKVFKKIKLNSDSIFFFFFSNIGDVTQYINDLYNCNIYCYEPHPTCFKILKKKFLKNSNIKIYNHAVSNIHKKNVKLFTHKDSPDINSSHYSQASSLDENKDNINPKKFHEIETRDIKNILEKFNYIDVIKIDIEGHEYVILPEIINNINKIGYVFCEFHGQSRKNKHLKDNYNFWINELDKQKLLNIKIFDWH